MKLLNRMIAGIRVAGLLVLPVVAPASDASADAARSYFQVKKDKREPVPQDVSAVKDELWLKIGYEEHAGFKPRLAVVFPAARENEDTPAADEDWMKNVDPNLRFLGKMSESDGEEEEDDVESPVDIQGLETIVRQALGATNQFKMVERMEGLDNVMAEQDFGASGRVEGKTAAPVGRLKGADYVVLAEVIEVNREKEARDIQVAAGALGAGVLGIGSVGVSGKVAFCRINIHVVNSATGDIVADLTVDGTAKSSSATVGGGTIGAVGGALFGGGGSSTSRKEAALSDAVQTCANKVAYHVAQQLSTLPWTGSVTSAADGKVRINAGTNIGLGAGLVLTVLKKGEEEIDPDTGESLGFSTMILGKVRIVRVEEKFSECEILEGCEGVDRGDMVKLERGGA